MDAHPISNLQAWVPSGTTRYPASFEWVPLSTTQYPANFRRVLSWSGTTWYLTNWRRVLTGSSNQVILVSSVSTYQVARAKPWKHAIMCNYRAAGRYVGEITLKTSLTLSRELYGRDGIFAIPLNSFTANGTDPCHQKGGCDRSFMMLCRWFQRSYRIAI